MTAQTATTVTQAFYAHCDPTNPLCRFTQERTDADIAFYRRLLPALNVDSSEDYTCWRDEIAAQLGMGAMALDTALFAVEILTHLPRLEALRSRLRHLPLRHLAAVSRALAGCVDNQAVMEAVDADLADYLTPTVAHQAFPTPQTLRRRINRILDRLVPPPAERPAEATPPPAPGNPTISAVTSEDDVTFVTAAMTVADATTFMTSLHRVSHKESLTLGQALMAILQGSVQVRATLNFFGTPEEGPRYLLGAGYLRAAEAAWARSQITAHRDLSAAPSYTSTTKHDAPTAVAAYVGFRDGGCRYPGCSCTTDLQLHHVIGFDYGGPTTASNLVSLCARHHNKVTFGHVRMFMTESGVCSWYFRTGDCLRTLPTGPLADPQRISWAYTARKRAETRARHSGRTPIDAAGAAPPATTSPPQWSGEHGPTPRGGKTARGASDSPRPAPPLPP